VGEDAAAEKLSRRKRFFFEKKKQKTSIHWNPNERSNSNGKSFLLLFFKKEALPFFF
jgi:hypothetical protein